MAHRSPGDTAAGARDRVAGGLTLFGVFLTSSALLVIELALTRIFSVTMYYHFAFLAISIALFGLSASGVYVYLLRDRLRPVSTERLLATHALVFSLATFLALALLVRLRVGLNYSPQNLVRMAAIYLLASAPFFAGGSVISIAIARHAPRVNLVYAADLIGASTGCLLLLPLLNLLGAPDAVLVAGGLAAGAAVAFAPARSRRRAGATAVILVAIPFGVQALGPAPFDVVDTKGHEGDRVLFSRWNSFSRVAVYERSHADWSLSPRYTGPLPDSRLMDIDSAASTPILELSGGIPQGSYLRYELTALAYHLKNPVAARGITSAAEPDGPVHTPESPFTALVIGTGGGRDLLSALVFGASSVDGVEINPIIVRDVMLGAFRAYSGAIYADPRVRVFVEDGRSFVRRSGRRYDVIQASLVDTWAATAAGAYTLTENTLYTVEAFDDYLDHLTDDGVLSISRWRFDGLRLVSLAAEACARRGWDHRSRTAIIQHDKVATFLFKRQPFTATEVDRLGALAESLDFSVVYLPGRPASAGGAGEGGDDYARLVETNDREAFFRAHTLDLTPTTDDRPFFFHTTKLRNQTFVAWARRVVLGRSDGGGAYASGGFATGGLSALLMLMGVSIVLVASFIVLPLALSAGRVLEGGWARWLAYFGCLGAGFMLFEVALLQRFVLLLGHPVYSLTVTLFSLLLGTGIGSFLSRAIPDDALRPNLLAMIGVVVLVGLVSIAAYPPIVSGVIGWPLPARIGLSVAMLVPVGLVMGVPLPTGMRLMSRSRPELVPWAWGMNGALSVVGSILAVFVAMTWGFPVALAGGLGCYVVAGVLLSPPRA